MFNFKINWCFRRLFVSKRRSFKKFFSTKRTNSFSMSKKWSIRSNFSISNQKCSKDSKPEIKFWSKSANKCPLKTLNNLWTIQKIRLIMLMYYLLVGWLVGVCVCVCVCVYYYMVYFIVVFGVLSLLSIKNIILNMFHIFILFLIFGKQFFVSNRPFLKHWQDSSQTKTKKELRMNLMLLKLKYFSFFFHFYCFIIFILFASFNFFKYNLFCFVLFSFLIINRLLIFLMFLTNLCQKRTKKKKVKKRRKKFNKNKVFILLFF